MNLPSKKLLSEVLGYNFEISCIELAEFEAKLFIYKEGFGLKDIINIYELMHLMKEWACDKSFMLTTWYSDEDEYTGREALCNIYEPYMSFDEITKSFIADTEFEAVTKACEYILEQLG